MKIIVNARFLTQPLSGVQRYGIECSRQIKKLHPDVTFVAPKNILHTGIANELDVKVIGPNTGHTWEQLDLPFYLARHKSPPLLSLANSAPLLYSNNFVTIHDLAFHHHPEWNSKAFSAWYNIMIPRLAIRSRHIFTVSQTIKNEIVNCYKILPAKISVAYNGISQRMLDTRSQRDLPKEKIILSVGTFNIRKNHEKLITAFLDSPLRDTYRLVIIGDKNKVFRETGINEGDLENKNIIIYPTLAEDELITMYKKAEIVVSLSLYEGFGIPLLEGLFNGCKILCSDIPVYREIYNNVATFCIPNDTNSIVGALVTVSNDAYKGNNINQLLEKYDYRRSADIILSTILPAKK